MWLIYISNAFQISQSLHICPSNAFFRFLKHHTFFKLHTSKFWNIYLPKLCLTFWLVGRRRKHTVPKAAEPILININKSNVEVGKGGYSGECTTPLPTVGTLILHLLPLILYEEEKPTRRTLWPFLWSTLLFNLLWQFLCGFKIAKLLYWTTTTQVMYKY